METQTLILTIYILGGIGWILGSISPLFKDGIYINNKFITIFMILMFSTIWVLPFAAEIVAKNLND